MLLLPKLPRQATEAEKAMAREVLAGRPAAKRDSDYREVLWTVVSVNAAFERAKA